MGGRVFINSAELRLPLAIKSRSPLFSARHVGLCVLSGGLFPALNGRQAEPSLNVPFDRSR